MDQHPPAWFDDVRARAAALNGTEAGLFTRVLYPGVGHRTSWVNLDGTLWLNHQLHFALWDDEAIRRAGTTHIATWVKATGADISPNYLAEEREGGIDAVGRGFPAIARENLMVFPKDEWEAKRSQLLYSAWAAKTLAVEQKQVPMLK